MNLENYDVQEINAVKTNEINGGTWPFWIEMWGGANIVGLNSNYWHGPSEAYS